MSIRIFFQNHFLMYLKSNETLFHAQDTACTMGRSNNSQKNHLSRNIIKNLCDYRYLLVLKMWLCPVGNNITYLTDDPVATVVPQWMNISRFPFNATPSPEVLILTHTSRVTPVWICK